MGAMLGFTYSGFAGVATLWRVAEADSVKPTIYWTMEQGSSGGSKRDRLGEPVFLRQFHVARGVEMAHAEPSGTRNDKGFELVRRILAGERGAEEELVERYSRGVSIVIGRIARNSSVTEDLCQEAFRLIVEKLRGGDLREPEKLSGFVCGLARNLAIDHLRRTRREAAPANADTDAASISDSAPDQLSHLLHKERANAVRQVMKELTLVRDREVLYRFYLADEDKEQICADLALSALHFNRVLHRARERFKKLYQKTGL